MLLEGIQGFAMAPGLPNIDNHPLDPGGQALGLVNPVGAYIGTPAGTAPPAPPKASATVPQSEGFLPSLEINPRELFPPLSSVPGSQEAPKTLGKRLQEHSPDGAERAPMKALIGPAYKDMEQALLGHFASSNSALHAEMAAMKAYMTSLAEAMEQRLTGQLGALERRFSTLEAQQASPNAPNHPLKPLSSGGDRQGPRQPLPSQGTTFAEVAHGPQANPNRAAKPIEPRRASPPISKPPPGVKPAAGPQWADIAASNAQEWQIVTKKRAYSPNQPPKVQMDPGSLKPIRGSNKGDRRLIFRRENGRTAPKKSKADIILQLNRCLAQAGFPNFARVIDANYTESGAISALLDQGSTVGSLLPAYKDLLVAACHRVDPAVISVEADQQWHKIKVHAVPVARYSASGLGLAREEIELGGTCTLMRNPTWIKPIAAIQTNKQRFSTIVITVGGLDDARRLLARGVRFGGNRHPTSPYHEVGKDTVCTRCCGIGHRTYRGCGTRPPLCTVCAGAHEAQEHTCNVLDCRAQTGHPCLHTPTKCGNCGGKHQADSPGCPKLREARRRLHKRFPGVEVVMPPPPPEWTEWEGVAEEASPPTTTQDAPQAPKLREVDDAMEDAPGTSPLPYSSPCPTPTPGAAAPINVDYST